MFCVKTASFECAGTANIVFWQLWVRAVANFSKGFVHVLNVTRLLQWGEFEISVWRSLGLNCCLNSLYNKAKMQGLAF